MVWEGTNPPTDPPEYDPNNKYADPVLYFKHREAKVAEEYVKVAEARLIRKKVKKCYRESGVNFQEDCKELVKQYLEAIKGVGIYRSNSGPHDEPRWKEFNAARE